MLKLIVSVLDQNPLIYFFQGYCYKLKHKLTVSNRLLIRVGLSLVYKA